MHNQSQESAHPSESTPLNVYFLWGFQLAVVFASIWDATRQRWLSDDAFISFRYAKNWSEGHGLVYNVGEWVEGYTNLLWTLWIGMGMRVGWQPEWFAHASSLSAFAVDAGCSRLVWSTFVVDFNGAGSWHDPCQIICNFRLGDAVVFDANSSFCLVLENPTMETSLDLDGAGYADSSRRGIVVVIGTAGTVDGRT